MLCLISRPSEKVGNGSGNQPMFLLVSCVLMVSGGHSSTGEILRPLVHLVAVEFLCAYVYY